MRFQVALLATFAIVLGGRDSAAQVVIAGQEDDSVPETQCSNPTQEPCFNDQPCYGQSVGISGSLAIVGAPDQLNDQNNKTGFAYIHSRQPGVQIRDRWNNYVILAPNVQGMAQFGTPWPSKTFRGRFQRLQSWMLPRREARVLLMCSSGAVRRGALPSHSTLPERSWLSSARPLRSTVRLPSLEHAWGTSLERVPSRAFSCFCSEVQKAGLQASSKIIRILKELIASAPRSTYPATRS